jgi:hypothetical protein
MQPYQDRFRELSRRDCRRVVGRVQRSESKSFAAEAGEIERLWSGRDRAIATFHSARSEPLIVAFIAAALQ